MQTSRLVGVQGSGCSLGGDQGVWRGPGVGVHTHAPTAAAERAPSLWTTRGTG